MADPINSVEWVPSRKLKANLYNPNVVFSPEMRLLEESILLDGWTAAILISTAFTIIDGFHRWRLSMDSPRIADRWAEEVPCIIMKKTEPEAMMMTIRMIRAKGSAVAVRLSDVVQELHNDYGMTIEGIMRGCGMDRDEVELLLAGSLLKTRKLDKYKYSNAWVPIETRHQQKEDAEAFEREEVDDI